MIVLCKYMHAQFSKNSLAEKHPFMNFKVLYNNFMPKTFGPHNFLGFLSSVSSLLGCAIS